MRQRTFSNGNGAQVGRSHALPVRGKIPKLPNDNYDMFNVRDVAVMTKRVENFLILDLGDCPSRSSQKES